jgi:small-conductance mechanosensitive channel
MLSLRMKRTLTAIGTTFILLTYAVPALAQQTSVPTAAQEAQLVYLYEQQLADPDATWAQERIATDLQRIRADMEQELLQTIAAPVSDELSESDLTRALDRQRTVVNTLKDRIAERKVDLELLDAEEQRYYIEPVVGTGAEAGGLRLTKTHGELLAKRAILQERIGALDSLLTLNEERLQKLTGDQRVEQLGFLRSAATYVLILVLIWMLERLVRGALLTRIPRLEVRYTAIKVFTAIIYSITALWLLSVLMARHPNIITSFAIIGAGVAIALQDVVKDILGWFTIRQSQLFTQGDRVSVGGETGEVIDIGILRTRFLEVGTEGQPVLERTGKILSLPNSVVLTQRVVNHSATSDFVRAEMPLTVTYQSNWQKAETILQEVLKQETLAYEEKERRQHASRTKMYFIPQQTRGPGVHVDLGADGIQFTLRFSVPIGERRPVVTRISREILKRFGEEKDIELAYKTSRVYSSAVNLEGEFVPPAGTPKSDLG